MRFALALILSVVAAQAAGPPAFRLPKIARPSLYELELTVIPRQSAFFGRVRIHLNLEQRTNVLWLNSKDLAIEKASLLVNGRQQPARASTTGEFLGLEFDEMAGPGTARIEIGYRGRMSDKTNRGLYRKNSGADWYAYTTFTPIEARRAFPCFDEPSYKAPWRVTLHVPRADVAASNAPVLSEQNEPNSMKRVEFDETKPLPSELVALAVGPFDVIHDGTAGAGRIPVRILAPRGRGDQAAGARGATAEILARVEEYTGIPYPWRKLDHVAVLDMPFGAVENPGLITYKDRAILATASRDTPEHRRRLRGTIAHELAHQWFGNLVTQAWWDDVWLSEGFATWMGMRTTDLDLPLAQRGIQAVNARYEIMRADESPRSRPVRLAMNSRKDMERVYGAMVYHKAAAVLRMLEHWLGEEPFRQGVRAYLAAHAFSTATTSDLVSALHKGTGVNVGGVLNSYLDQEQFPSVAARPDCGAEKLRVILKSTAAWTSPACVRADAGVSQCAVVADGAQEIPVDAACPVWVWPNRAGAGYYRVELSDATLEAIVQLGWDQLTAPERLSVVEDAAGSAAAGKISRAAFAKLLPVMTGDPEPAVANAAHRALLAVFSGDRTPEYDSLIKKVLGGRRRR